MDRLSVDEVNALDFTDKTVLVVGGSSGIGNGIAQAFRHRGAAVHVWGTRAGVEDYAGVDDSDLSGLAYARIDVADGEAIAAVRPPFDTLDILVLSQGRVIYRRGEFDMAGFREVIEVNLVSVMACAMRFHPLLKASRGSLIVIGSTAGFRTARGNPAYAASKAGVAGLTRTLADAWACDGIRVNAIAPGLVDTKMTKVTTDHGARLAASLDRIPLRRLGTPQDMAGAALFLASPFASYIVGHVLPVDGGLIL